MLRELEVAVKPVSTIKISIVRYKKNFTAIFPCLNVGLPRGVRWVFKMVLYPLLAAEALCVITKHKSISSFEVCNSDSGVRQSEAFSMYQGAANRSLDYTIHLMYGPEGNS